MYAQADLDEFDAATACDFYDAGFASAGSA